MSFSAFQMNIFEADSYLKGMQLVRQAFIRQFRMPEQIIRTNYMLLYKMDMRYCAEFLFVFNEAHRI